MTEQDPDARKKLTTRTRLTSAGRKPREQFGFVNTPIYRGSTVLYPTYADLAGAQRTLQLRHPGHADDARAGGGLERARRRRDHRAHPIRPRGDHGRAARRGQGRRPHPGDGQRLPADAHLLRHGAGAPGRRDHLFRSDARPRGRRPGARDHQRAVLEAPGSQSFEVPDLPAYVTLARAQPLHDPRQHLGDAAVLCRRMRWASTWRPRPAPNTCRVIPTC